MGLEGPDDSRMAVSLIDGGIGAQEIQIFFSLDIPHPDTLGFFYDDIQGVVVVRAVKVFEKDKIFTVHNSGSSNE